MSNLNSLVLPEPAVVATAKHESTTKGTVEFSWGVDALKEEGEHKLFTEQQVRALLAGVSAPAAQAVASIYVSADGQRECDDWKVPLPIGRNLLYTAPQAQADARDAESDYQRGYRHGYNRRNAEVQGALL